jgi:C4-type Zn-finger protein
MIGEFQDDNMETVVKTMPKRKVNSLGYVTYYCPLCSSALETVEDIYEDSKGEINHIGYECYECGYEWIES